jgi:hypothetical protein
MNQFNAAINLYKEAIRDTIQTLARSHLAMVFLLVAFIVMLLAYPALSPFGIAGGFALGMMEAWIAGWYLALVEIGVAGRRKITVDDIRECSGVYFWEVISVLFLFFIARLLLMGMPAVLFIVVPVATVLFNPAPEMIYQDRVQSLDLLGRSVKFMQENWPEWIGGHLLPFGLLTTWAYLMTGSWSSDWILSTLTLFGPWFEFIQAGSLAIMLGGTGVGGLFSFVGIFIFVHGVMLFRGNLYKRLRHSSRRSRAWQARL